MDTLIYQFYSNILNNSQRILTALDRDPDSPTYGSFDRDYWHYKIRDFSSMVLHQASLTVDELQNWEYEKNIFYKKTVMRKWVAGSIKHWCDSQLKDGSFNEYYPYEHGYPPTAFSLYTTAILLLDKQYDDQKAIPHIEKACEWILQNPEKEASNQEAIGLAAVYLASKIQGVQIDANALKKRLDELFVNQDDEGWFPEYHGPDIGYLAVTMDALWDYYRYSKDSRAYEAMIKAAKFIALFLTESGNLPVMINSRNTDYLVPYGLLNICFTEDSLNSLAFSLLKKINEPFNYLETTDDRYLCHYVFTSCVRSIPVLEKFLKQPIKDLKPISTDQEYNLKSSGIFIKKTQGYTLYINRKKGGVIYLYNKGGVIYTDHGYRYKDNKTIAVTHWLSDDVTYITDKNTINIQGNMISRKWLVPTPLKHIALRVLSFTLGNRVIPFLKKIFIFGDKKIAIIFKRSITISNEGIDVEDYLESLADQYTLEKIKSSPFYSLRHVSSAVRFTPDELLWDDLKFKQIIKKTKATITIKTNIPFNIGENI